MASLKHRLESSLDGTLGEISYIFSYVLYGPIEAVTVEMQVMGLKLCVLLIFYIGG